MDRNPFFVLSSGRSGSETISRVLNQIPGCECRHHPSPELILESTKYFIGSYSKPELDEILRASRIPQTQRKGVYGEANLQLSLVIPLLDEIFPNCRFVWLMRDGRDVVASMYYRGWYDPLKAPGLGVWHLARLQGDETGDFDEKTWNEMAAFERCCWIWKKYNLIIESELSNFAERRWKKVKLESLKSSLDDISNFLDMPLRGKRIRVERRNFRKQPVTHWTEWSQEQVKHFEFHCADVMDRWYPAWRETSGRWCPILSEQLDEPTLIQRSKRRVKRGLHRVLMKLDSYVR